jgi:uncharacterized protein (UPF0276 family)
MQALPKLGVGLNYQAPLKPLIDSNCPDIDFIEVVPDVLWTDLGPEHLIRYVEDSEGAAHLHRIRESKPLVAHSIGASIGSAHSFDLEHIEQLRRWWLKFKFPWHSDHLAFHVVEHDRQRMNAGITLPLARDRESLELLTPRIHRIQREMPIPFLLENNVYYFDVGDSELDEPTFLNSLCKMSGCGLLLDLHNIYTNARNHGFDAYSLLAELDLSTVGEIHVAGGMELNGAYLDAHSDVVPDDVWAMLEWTLPRCPNVGGVVFELFGSWFEDVGEELVRADLRRLKSMWSQIVEGRPAVAFPAARRSENERRQ